MKWIARISLVAILIGPVSHAAGVPEPEGYRLNHYRAPTPDQLTGARTIDSATLAQLIETERPILIDVLPAPHVVDEQQQWHWVPSQPRLHVPQSIWLPDVGQGAPDPRIEAYFRATLQRLHRAAPEKALVFYCLRDCWMSWNAARRALEWGYRNVIWYPDGGDGWKEIGRSLEEGHPEPLSPL